MSLYRSPENRHEKQTQGSEWGLYRGSRDTGYLPFYFQGYRILSILLPGIWDTMFNFRDTAIFPPKYTNTE